MRYYEVFIDTTKPALERAMRAILLTRSTVTRTQLFGLPLGRRVRATLSVEIPLGQEADFDSICCPIERSLPRTMRPFYLGRKDKPEVTENLCTRDRRHPSWDLLYGAEEEDEIPPPREGCVCDNCFSGRDELAVEILRLHAMMEES